MGDRDAVGAGDRYTQPGPGAGDGGDGEFTAQVRVERAEAVVLAGALGQAEQRGQREHQVRQPERGRWIRG
jgi:hypothetical protein